MRVWAKPLHVDLLGVGPLHRIGPETRKPGRVTSAGAVTLRVVVIVVRRRVRGHSPPVRRKRLHASNENKILHNDYSQKETRNGRGMEEGSFFFFLIK